MSFYDRMAALVDRQLAAKGEDGLIRRTEVSGGGPSDPTGGTETVTEYPCRVAAFPVDQRDVDGTFIKSGDWRALIATGGLDVVPTTTDLLVCSVGVLTIVDPGEFKPAGTVTHYRMLARKA